MTTNKMRRKGGRTTTTATRRSSKQPWWTTTRRVLILSATLMATMHSFGGFVGTNFGPKHGGGSSTVSKESKNAFFYVEAQTTGGTGSTTETEATVA